MPNIGLQWFGLDFKRLFYVHENSIKKLKIFENFEFLKKWQVWYFTWWAISSSRSRIEGRILMPTDNSVPFRTNKFSNFFTKKIPEFLILSIQYRGLQDYTIFIVGGNNSGREFRILRFQTAKNFLIGLSVLTNQNWERSVFRFLFVTATWLPLYINCVSGKDVIYKYFHYLDKTQLEF